MWKCGLSEVKEWKDIRLERLVQLLFCDIQNTFLWILDTVIIDQNVQLAEGANRMLHSPEAILLMA
ncbi:hypothetical protein D3C76_1385420 [compost metagenome]